MTWTKFFDAIYLINLPYRTQRFMDAAEELNQYDIPFTTVHAKIGYDKPHLSLISTMKDLMMMCAAMGKKKIMVFEDDVQFVENPNNYMPQVIRQLDGLRWDMLSLGPNSQTLLEKQSPNLLRMKECRALHAMAYSVRGIDFIRATHFIGDDEQLDEIIEKRLQPQGHCYCTYPLLATQQNGPSDIGAETDKSYIVERFKQNTFHLK